MKLEAHTLTQITLMRQDNPSGGRGGRYNSRGRGRFAHGLRPVTESTRICIADQLADFQKGNDTELRFPAGLSNHDRAVVHAEALKYGFKSRSAGLGNSRQVTVVKRKASGESKNRTFDVPFTEESHRLVRRYLERYPPNDAEKANISLAEANARSTEAAASSHEPSPNPASVGNPHKAQRKKQRLSQGAAFFSPEEVQRRRETWAAKQEDPQVQALNAARQALPIAAKRGEIVASVEQNQVVLVAGETGCGKTTQVPQYILENAWSQKKGCKVICTQPRRISAVTIADRVAAERGERPGDNVGYTIRLESSGGPNSSLMFCTNGVLLRMLTTGDGLHGVTHVVVDEIHERDCFADFLLILLKGVLRQMPQLRVILMSATLHIDLFSGYFGGCPVIQVPGLTYPVSDIYLEELLPMIGYQPAGNFAPRPKQETHSKIPIIPHAKQKGLDDAIVSAFLKGGDEEFQHLLQECGAAEMGVGTAGAPFVNIPHSKTGGTALMVAAGKGRLEVVMSLLSSGADPLQKSSDGSTALDWARKFGHAEVATFLDEHVAAIAKADEAADNAVLLSRYQATTDAEEVDLNLIEMLLSFVYGETNLEGNSSIEQVLGAVLVFLPGWDEIIRLKEKLEAQSGFGTSRYQILALHSMVPAADQRKVFMRPPTGICKIVLATNIAETAVTIDDIVCVINTGRMKEKSYDPYTAVSTLMSTWVSRASEKQRRGRAGRCQAGVCFHLYTRQRSEALQEFQLPELQRTPLDELCLQVKLLEGKGFGKWMLAEFLAKAVEPPPTPSVQNAIQLLEEIGALEPKTEALTLLGKHLAVLPLPPKVGKMLLYGILFQVLDPILTVACCMAYRSPWVLPIESTERRRALAAKQQLASEVGGCSDHLALVKAYQRWAAAAAAGRERQYAVSMHINSATMKMIQGMRKQLLGELQGQGFVRTLEEASGLAGQSGLVRSVLGAAFYPQFGHVLPAALNNQQKGVKLVTSSEEKVKVHVSSLNCDFKPEVNGRSKERQCPVLIFDEKTRNESTLSVMQTTLVTPHALLLVANRLQAQADMRPVGGADVYSRYVDSGNDDDEDLMDSEEEGYSRILVDGWLSLRIRNHILEPLTTLRRRLADGFAAKVANPRAELSPSHSALLAMLSGVFTAEARSRRLDGLPETRGAVPGHPSGSSRDGDDFFDASKQQTGRGRGRHINTPRPKEQLYSNMQRQEQPQNHPAGARDGPPGMRGALSTGGNQASADLGRGRQSAAGRGHSFQSGRGSGRYQQQNRLPGFVPGRGSRGGRGSGGGHSGREDKGGRFHQQRERDY